MILCATVSTLTTVAWYLDEHVIHDLDSVGPVQQILQQGEHYEPVDILWDNFTFV